MKCLMCFFFFYHFLPCSGLNKSESVLDWRAEERDQKLVLVGVGPTRTAKADWTGEHFHHVED